MAFEALPPSGNPFTMDAYPEVGGQGLGPTPLEAFVSAVAACSAMDVISILGKKQQKVTSYKIEIDGERGPEGVYPRGYVSLTIKHLVEGPGLDDVAVARAVQLSDEKYCSVMATIRTAPKISVLHETKTL